MEDGGEIAEDPVGAGKEEVVRDAENVQPKECR